VTGGPLADPAVRRLVVTGHPNHELAIFGLVQRLRPRLLFLTDGGGEQRVAESRRGLAALGLLDRARFLPWPEERLYRALLDGEREVFAAIASEVRREVEAYRPAQVLCESVEFYNPLHDVTLPIVRAALRGLPEIEVIEFPLVAQVPDPGERYRVQRLPPARAGEAIAFHLTATELAAKLAARDTTYSCLRRQLAPIAGDLDDRHFALEHYAPAAPALPRPGVEEVLRYEWRGRLLRDRGEVERVITHAGHFLPLVAALAG
jgi:hypothetical protein